jgi:ribokinase
VAGHAVPVVDTIGAGDTFTGALVAALTRQEDWQQALVSANAAAALSTQGRGAVAAMPSLAQVQRWRAQG